MSEFYYDQIERIVRNKFADSVMDCLRDANPMQLSHGMDAVRVPLVAGASVIYEKGLGQFVIDARVKASGQFLGGTAVFSEKPIITNADAANVIDHVIAELRHTLHKALAERELQRVIRGDAMIAAELKTIGE